nr:hypothetical protein [uncultured Pedobacter sp.]
MSINKVLGKFLFLISFYCLAGVLDTAYAQAKYAERLVNFNLPNGPYTNEMLAKDFGNGRFPENRGFAEIQNEVYKVTFLKGVKVNNTGAATQIYIEPGEQYTLEYRIKYDDTFEKGLHGKQLGFDIGEVYNGGRGEEARQNGDGGSVRLQFDAKGDSISNQLYVYYCEMTGKYGNNPGNQKYTMPRGVWNTIKLKVSMQSSVEKSDGRIEVWCNHEKKIDVGGLRFVNKESGRKITKLSFESFPGGAGIFPTHDNYLYIDDVHWWKNK